MQGHVHSTNLDDEQAWMDIDAIPLYLHAPSHSDYLTLVYTSGVHFITVRYCSCLGVPDHYLQLLCASLYLTTILRLRTVFSFRVLNDFIRDNLECGTSSMNYYSNLRQITSNVFPHVIPVFVPMVSAAWFRTYWCTRTDIGIYSELQGNGDCSNCWSDKDSDTERLHQSKVNWSYSVLHAHNPESTWTKMKLNTKGTFLGYKYQWSFRLTCDWPWQLQVHS